MGKDMELLNAVKGEDIMVVQRIVSKIKAKQKKQGTIRKSPLNFQDEDGFSALHHAALNSNCNIMAALLECNQISVDIKDNKGMRPLHYAAWQGKVQPVYLLVKFGSAPNEGSQDGETPLHLASQYGSHMVVETLLQFQANPTLKNKNGKTALDLAAEFGRLKVVQLLMNSNQSTALLDIPSRTTRTRVSMHTALHVAAKNGHSDVIRVLLEYGIDINRETPNGTALHEAALAGKSEVVKLLIASGIDVYKKNSHGQTALDIVNKFTPTRAAQDIKQLLRDSIGGSQARALQDYVRIHDRSALSFKSGDIISILARNPDGKWKGSITKGNVESIGYFPSSHVELLTRPVSTSSLSQQSTFSYASTSPTSTGPSLPIGPPYPHASTPLSSMPGSVTPPSSNVLVDTTTNRYSSDSTTSASSSGNWSNRETFDQMYNQSLKHGYYHPASSNAGLSPPPPPPPQPMNGSIPYGKPEDKPFPTAPHDHYHGNIVGSPPRAMAGSPQHIHSPTNDHAYHSMSPQHPMSPRRQHPDVSRQLENGIWMKRGGSGKINVDTSGEESGVDVSSSTESMEKRSYGGIPTPGNAPTIHMNVNTKPLSHSQPFHSFENVLGDRDTFRSLAGNQRPHSDGSPDIKMDIMRHPDIKPQYQGKDCDRIYEWLKRQRMPLPEYTNNFTKAGYDMPTIARMTPEDLTAIGVTKPGHRKRISAMISQLNEPDAIPSYKPPDVVTWLKLLDLYQYYNTFVSNSYNTIEAVSEITWEDLQEIGINQLGHQKKFSLAIKRLRDLQKQATRVMASAQQTGSAGSDNDSTSPHSSNDGVYHHYQHPNTLLIAQVGHRTSPLQSPDNSLVKKRSGLRSSQESLGSDGSNKSSGSHGSHEQVYAKKIVHMKQRSESREASYIPTSLKVSGGSLLEHRVPSPEGENVAVSSTFQTFSTFRHPPVSTAGGTFKIPAVPRDRKSNDSLERVLASQGSNFDSVSGTPKRNSVEGGSSIGSSGSGDGSVKMKRSNPPAPPKRTNSIRTVDEEQLKTATIGRKKSLKQFREEMAAGSMTKKVELPEGYATIKRSATRKTPVLNRSASQEADYPPGGTGVAMGAPAPPTVPAFTQGSGVTIAGGITTTSAPSQQSHGTISGNKSTDEITSQISVNYSAYGVTNQPVLTSEQQPGQSPVPHSKTSMPSRSASVPTSPVNMQQLSWTNQQMSNTRDSGEQGGSTSISSSSTPSHIPIISQSNAALIAEMQQSITASMHPSARLNPQCTVKSTPDSSYIAPVVTTNSTPQPMTVMSQLPINKAEDTAGTQRQSTGVTSVFSNTVVDTQARPVSGGIFKIPENLPPHTGNRPSSGEQLLQNTNRRPSSGGFKLGIDIELEKQHQMRMPQSDVSMREGVHNNIQRPPSTGSTGSGGSSSTDSGSNKHERPSNMELLWKRMSQEGEEHAPIIQPALSKPLEGIWRPKSRHYEMGGQLEDQNQADSSSEGESNTLKLQTKATFRSLKKQFLDQNSTPITYHTLKRPPKKPDPNFFEEDFRPRSKSFTDTDEYNQSPVAKDAPIDFETFVAREEAALEQPDSNNSSENHPASLESRSHPPANDSPQQTRTQGSPVKLPFPDNGGHTQKPISLPGLVSNYVANDDSQEQVLNNQTHPPNVFPLKAPLQVPLPKIPQPQSLPPQVPPPPPQIPPSPPIPPPPQIPPPQVPPHKVPSPEESSKVASQKLSPQHVLPPKVSPKATRVKATVPTPPPVQQDMMPPPPPVEDLPPPPPNEELPLPPPPSQDYDLPPPPPDEAGLPPPPPLQTNAPPFSLLSSYNFPAPPPSMQQVSQKQEGGPQTAPKGRYSVIKKKSSHRTPVVSEGWESNSDTIKRKPNTTSPVLSLAPDSLNTDAHPKESKLSPSISEKKKKSPVKAPVKVPEKSVKSPSRAGKAPVKVPAKRNPVVAPPPLEDSDDVDFYSQDLDMMDTFGEQEDAVESDSSDTMESALSGFENENTDTIKKQPLKLSPARTNAEMNSPEIVGIAFSSDHGYAVAMDNGADVIKRERNETGTSKNDRDSQGFGEVSLQLADILNSMGSDDPLANFAASAEASAKARMSPTKPISPAYTAPTVNQEPAESKDIFTDIESMFNDLTFDLENMMN